MYLNFSLNICQNLKLCFNQKQNVTVKNILIVDSKKKTVASCINNQDVRIIIKLYV